MRASTAFEVRGVLVDRDGYQEIILPDAFDPDKMVGKPLTLNFGQVIGQVTSATVDRQGLRVTATVDKRYERIFHE